MLVWRLNLAWKSGHPNQCLRLGDDAKTNRTLRARFRESASYSSPLSVRAKTLLSLCTLPSMKRRQFFSGAYNETLPVIAMRVCNPDRSLVGVISGAAPRFDATGAILTRLFGGFAPDFPHYISGKEFKK